MAAVSGNGNNNKLIIRNEEKQETGPSINSVLPPEIILKIFEFLNRDVDLVRASLVCWDWYDLACSNTLWKGAILPFGIFIEQSDWEKAADLKKLGLTFEGKKPFNFIAAYPKIKKLKEQVEGNEQIKIAVLDIPKGASPNIIQEIVGTKIGIQFGERFKKQFGDIKTEKASTVVITFNVLKDSINKSADAQKAMVNALGCKMPKLVHLFALCGLTGEKSTTLPYGENIRTRCQETDTLCRSEDLGFYHVTAGDFSKEAFSTQDAPEQLSIAWDSLTVGSKPGVGAVMEFSEQSSAN